MRLLSALLIFMIAFATNSASAIGTVSLSSSLASSLVNSHMTYRASLNTIIIQPANNNQNCAQYDDARNNPFISLVGKKRVRCNKRTESTRVQRYVLGNGRRAFLFQDIGNRARIQFLCGPDDTRFECQLDPDEGTAEIHTLTVTRAPRGDVIYKDAQGETVLRIASYGGATVWWPGNDKAQAASRSFSDRRTIGLRRADQRRVIRTSRQATAMLRQRTGAGIVFETGIHSSAFLDYRQSSSRQSSSRQILNRNEQINKSADLQGSRKTVDQAPEGSNERATLEPSSDSEVSSLLSSEGLTASSFVQEFPAQEIAPQEEEIISLEEEEPSLEDRDISLLADSVMVTSIGVAAVAADPTGARVIGNRLKKVRFFAADRSEMRLNDMVLDIFYNPALGLAGRPSSIEITKFLEENL